MSMASANVDPGWLENKSVTMIFLAGASSAILATPESARLAMAGSDQCAWSRSDWHRPDNFRCD
jgi:hypothetical protein